MGAIKTFSQLFFYLPILLCQFAESGYAYMIDAHSCQNHNLNEIRASADEALNMAAYASWRMSQNDPRVGEVLKQYLGSNGKQRLIERMNAVPAAIGTYSGSYSPNMNDYTVVIQCGTGHFTRRQIADGSWEIWDNRFNNFRPMADSPGHGCGENTVGYTYHTFTASAPHSVIVLCDGGHPAALSNDLRIDHLWQTTNWNGFHYDNFYTYMSNTLVHEFMHCLRAGVTATLPSGIGEQYEWDTVRNLANADKEANAQGYSAMATGFWLRFNTMGASGKMSRRFPVNNRPGPGPHLP